MKVRIMWGSPFHSTSTSVRQKHTPWPARESIEGSPEHVGDTQGPEHTSDHPVEREKRQRHFGRSPAGDGEVLVQQETRNDDDADKEQHAEARIGSPDREEA